MAVAIATTIPTRSNLRWDSNHLVVSLFFFSSVLLMQMPKGNVALAPEEESTIQVLRERFKLPDWPAGPDSCKYSWVACSNSTGSQVAHVKGIVLRGNLLVGPIPDLSNLTNLRYLDLSYNRLSGRILDTTAFTSISTILLGHNNLTGGIPASLFQHPSVIEIDLSHNRLSGRIPDTTALNNISIIRLDHNNLTGGIPPSLFQHPSVIEIDLSGNPLGGPIPDMRALRNLQNLSGSNCNFEGPLPDIMENIKIKNLLLANNQLTSVPLLNYTKLGAMDISNNKMSGNLPELPHTTIYNLPLDLNFENNNFSGEIPVSWTEQMFLTKLRLGNNGLSGSIPVRFEWLTSLQELNLTNNNFSGPIPNEIGRLEHLTSLDLRNNLFNDAVPEALASLPNLATLWLENNRFTTIPEALIQKSKEGLYLTYDDNVKIQNRTGPNRTAEPDLSNSTAESDLSKSTAKSDLSTGAIVGIVFANGFLVSVLGFILYVISRRNNKHVDQLSKEHMPKSSRAFTLKQIKAVTANNKTLIGKGGFGQVYHGKLPDGKEVAVKVRAVDSKQGAQEFLNEVRLLSRLHHRNLVPLVGYCLEAQQQILVYQYMAAGTLHKHLYHTGYINGSVVNSSETPSYQPLDWKTRLDIAINAARGLEYLHKDCNPPVIHRDVKSSNILLTRKLQAKVADLGISKQAPEPDSDLDETHNLSGVFTVIKGTFGYLDPEYYVRRKLTTKSDVYSFGVVLLEIITGRRPQSHNFPNSAETNLIDWVRDAVSNNEVESVVDDALKGKYKGDCMLKVAKTALSCVSPRGAERPDMGEIVRILIEALQMEGQYIETSSPSTEITVPFSGPMNPTLGPRSARSLPHSTQSYEAFLHPSWNTDPR